LLLDLWDLLGDLEGECENDRERRTGKR
jgi:hypothetical protein